MRESNSRVEEQHPVDPQHMYTGSECAELQHLRNSLGSRGIAKEKAFMANFESREPADITAAQRQEYKTYKERADKRSASSRDAGTILVCTVVLSMFDLAVQSILVLIVAITCVTRLCRRLVDVVSVSV